MINKEDYEEPMCLLLDEDGNPRNKEKINIGAVISKLDSLYNKEDYQSAKKVICYWLEEANILGDIRSAFVMYDEGIGLARKTMDKTFGMLCIEKAFLLADNPDIIDRISAGTAYLNGATTLKAFGKVKEAMPYYEKAYKIFSEKLEKGDYRFASLYNNYALALVDAGETERAEKMYMEAIENLGDDYPLEKAISYTNLSDLYYKKQMLDECDHNLQKAFHLIENFKGKRDGYFAFVCKKCATAFSYHGFFMEEKKLLLWADEIYSKM